ncbi:hypothetical protein PYL83_07895, partial [Moraxella lacunata]|uniref:hypothetical protein n=1 Tax=Moraxella lacunata TaxID=477 RepID=UPI00247FC77E
TIDLGGVSWYLSYACGWRKTVMGRLAHFEQFSLIWGFAGSPLKNILNYPLSYKEIYVKSHRH